MTRNSLVLPSLVFAFLLVGCGGGTSVSPPPPPPPQNFPVLNAIAPSTATAGSSAINLVLYGSSFENGATVEWNGTALMSSSWVSATEMTATIPASDIASVGSAKVTVTNPSPGGGTSTAQSFAIIAAPTATTWVRSLPGISTAKNIVWDAAHGKLYMTIPSTDTTAPNTVIAVDPVTGTAETPVAAGNDPDLLSISSDSSYLWVGLDGANTLQRFLLPGLTKDISIPVPLDSTSGPQQPVGLLAAPISPHAVALTAGSLNFSPSGRSIYIYDDATQRATSVTSTTQGDGPTIFWTQWGANDSAMYANQFTRIDAGGIATLNVNSAGVSLSSYADGPLLPLSPQYDKIKGLIYSNIYGSAFNPVDGSLAGTFELGGGGERACAADSRVGRYYCVIAYPIVSSVTLFELWVFDLNTYALINRVYFGATSAQTPSLVTGGPIQLVRWGNAGLALITNTGLYSGNGGLFLIDGAAVNSSGAPDVSSGISPSSYALVASLTPQEAPSGSGNVTVTVKGSNFTQDSTACLNCDYLNFRFLPTSYVSSQQLSITIPASLVATAGQLPINVFDPGSNLFSPNSLTFTVGPSAVSSGGQVTPLQLAGLAVAWDANSALLYVGTADYDTNYPNSIVAVDGNGSIVKTQTVTTNPYVLSVSASGQYLYAGFDGATLMTQLQLPGLGSPLTWPLTNPSVSQSAVYWAGDIKAAPASPHTTAVTLFNLTSDPPETGGVVVYDDNVERPNVVPGWGGGQAIPTRYDTLAWGSTDAVLTGASAIGYNGGPLFEFQVSPAGATLLAAGTASFNVGQIHSDFGTGLVYSDDGKVADPATQAIVGTYNASGLAAPDSSLNRVFIIGQTAAQGGTNNYTLQSFDEKAFTLVSSITLSNLVGSPIELVRWGASGLAVLTKNQSSGSPGMLYLIQDPTFVSSAQVAASPLFQSRELVQRRWKAISRADIAKMVQARRASRLH
ncbi:MAG TPA: IPT/TIG domain-containing protein [Candidatus Acidoferrum sp.]|nr:IPT/TIG domain-containing protein [Candidatus Acidoferrum sp.]